MKYSKEVVGIETYKVFGYVYLGASMSYIPERAHQFSKDLGKDDI